MRAQSVRWIVGMAFALCALVGPAQAHPGHDHEAAAVAPAAPAPAPLAAWDFRPHGAVGAPAALRSPNPAPARAGAPAADGARIAPARVWSGAAPTERRGGLLEGARLPSGPFSLELFVTYHVDRVVGAALLAYEPDRPDPRFAFGFTGGDVTLRVGAATLTAPVMLLKSSEAGQDPARYRTGALRYWHHLVAVSDGRTLSLWHNGQRVAQRDAPRSGLPRPAQGTEVELAGYLAAEPHMQLGDLVRAAAIYDRALSAEDIAAAFAHRLAPVAAGAPIPEAFHFTTGGPHLAFPSQTAISVLWETDRPAAARLEWGPTEQLGQALDLPANGQRQRRARIEGLTPGGAQFYKLTVTAPGGETLVAGPTPFRTAVAPGQPVVFAALSDTEARPHVNAHLATVLWSESPHLIVNAGDLTDGGKGEHRFEWTHEYFAALGPLMGRTPFVPVMGNGEDDFLWFERYHALPEGGGRSYYAYRYGDVEFFVLDSNLERRDAEDPAFRPAQRAWLARALAASTARWKVATFHHPALGERYPKVVEDFVPLFETHGVDLVLVGHHHHYLRSWPLRRDQPVADGPAPIYVQLGGGGGNVSNRPSVADVRWAKTYQGYGYVMVRAFGDTLSLAMHDDAGDVRDSFTIRKGREGWRLTP